MVPVRSAFHSSSGGLGKAQHACQQRDNRKQRYGFGLHANQPASGSHLGHIETMTEITPACEL